MHSFRNDYSEGCHPAVLEALTRTNFEQADGYTDDEYCGEARSLIRDELVRSVVASGATKAEAATAAHAQVEFVPGGTMANLLVITSALRPHECVISAPEGHINMHETGAIEANGHKVVTTDDTCGLLSVEGVDKVMQHHCYRSDYHMVYPRMLYLSFATEMGLTHSAQQLRDLRAYADRYDLLIYIDGARLACGLASPANDVTLGDIFQCADAFTFGGTKNGALFGEAIVIKNPLIGSAFRSLMKQKGAVMAKGRLLGVQFGALFGMSGSEAQVPEACGDELLYFSLGRHSVQAALQVKHILAKHGFSSFASDSYTNQQFVQVPHELVQFLVETFNCEEFGITDDGYTIVRFVCSWATTQEHLDELDRVLGDFVSHL